MKKKLLMAVSYLLILALGVAGTVAYFTDRDAETNVFTVGNVEIELNEEFKQGAELLPGRKIDKNASIKNTGKNDAWVWLTVLLPVEFGPYTAPNNMSASNNVVHWNLPKDNAGNITIDFNATPIEVDPDGDGNTAKYYQTDLLYKNVLKSDEDTGIMFSTVYMDAHVDMDPDGNMYWVNGGSVVDLKWNVKEQGNPKIYVSAYAIQAESFADVEAARAAYGTQWGENGTEYAPVVSTAQQFNEAVENGGDIVVEQDVKLTDRVSVVKTATIDLAGNTLTAEEVGGYDDVLSIRAEGVVLKNGTIKAETGYPVAIGHSGNNITGTVTIESGTYIGKTTAIQVGQGELVIKGGYFEVTPYNDSYEYTINCIDTSYNQGTAKVTVIGGTFFNFDPSNNASEGAGTDYVPEGYKVIAEADGNGNTLYTVVAE